MITRAGRALGRGIGILSLSGGTFAGITMLIAAIITCYEIIARYVFNSPTVWTLEVSVFILIWFGFISIAYVQREGRHIHVDILVSRLSSRTRAIWDVMTMIFSLFFVGILTYYSYDFFIDAFKSHETTLSLFVAPMWVPKLALFAGGTILALQLINDIVSKCNTILTQPLERGEGLRDNPFFLIAAFLTVVGIAVWLYQVAPLAGLVVLMLTLLFAGVPIFAALALVGITGFFFLFGGLQALSAVPHIGYGGLYNFGLACLPLFIIAGQVLADSGVGNELYDLCDKWVGHLPGGLSIATILACAIFAAVAISSVAVAIAIGLIALPSLIAHKYDKRFSYGVLAAGGTLGLMIPPSGTMIIYSMVTEESLGKLFVAGLIPGIILMAMFAVYSVLFCARTGAYEKAEPYTWKERFGALKTGIWGLLAPLIIVAGIYSGIFTPLEAGAVVAVYALVMSVARGKIKVSQVPRVLKESAANGAMILIIIACALMMGTFMTLLQVPNMVINLIAGSGMPNWAVMVAIMFMYLVLGMFLDVVSVMLITLPVVYPLIIAMGFDGIWFAVLVTLNMEMALITPPVGLNLYVIKGITGAPITDVLRGVFPFFVIMVIGMVLVFLFPQLSTWLPGVMVR